METRVAFLLIFVHIAGLTTLSVAMEQAIFAIFHLNNYAINLAGS